MLHLGDVRLAKQLPGQLQFFVVGMALYLYGERLRVPPWSAAAIAVAFLARVDLRASQFRRVFGRWSSRPLCSALRFARRSSD